MYLGRTTVLIMMVKSALTILLAGSISGYPALAAETASQGLLELPSSELNGVSTGGQTSYIVRSATSSPTSDMDVHDAVSESEAQARWKDSVARTVMEEVDQPVRVLTSVFPKYPVKARANEIEGDVIVEITINTDGKVGTVRVLQSPDDLLSAASIEAVEQWRFAPMTRNGKPVELKVIQKFPFKLL